MAVVSSPTSTDPKYTYVEKTVTRKGKTYKQWFKVKVGAAPAAKKAAAALMANAESVTPVAKPAGPAQRLVAAKKALEKEPPVETAADRLMAKKVGGQLGSNEGGMYVGKDGVQRYVKHYKDPLQAASEHLTAQIYKDLGHMPPTTQLFDHAGKKSIASDVIEGKKLDVEVANGTPEHRKQIAQEFMKGFTADVLTANWDAAGLSKDNAIVSPQGFVHRIDMGGSLLKRASGGDKPPGALNKITEWEGLFDPKLNKSYSDMAQMAGLKKAEDLGNQLHQDLGKILKLQKKYGGWDGYIAKTSPELAKHPEQFRKIADMLEARTKLLKEKIDTVPPGDPGVGFKYVQKEILKKGKTYKQWFKVKDKDADPKKQLLKKMAHKDMTPQEKRDQISGLKVQWKSKDSWTIHDMNREAVEKLNYEATMRYGKASPAAKEAANAFVGSSYKGIRVAQATEGKSVQEANEMAKAYGITLDDVKAGQRYLKPLAEFQEHMRIDNPTKHGTLYRGMNVSLNTLHAMLNGEAITHNGYSTTSSSYSKSTAKGFLRGEGAAEVFVGNKFEKDPHKEFPVLIAYKKVRSGTNMIFDQGDMSSEKEIALGKGTFKIVARRFIEGNDQYDKGHFEIEVEEED
jgi:hypothetical protein